MRSLIWREWRELRSVTYGCALLALVVTVLMQHFVYKYNEAEWAARDLVPWMTGLYVGIAASDLISGDVRSRRIDELMRLPVSIGSVWRAKVVFLLLVATAFAGTLWLAQALLPLLAGRADTAAATLTFIPITAPNMYFVAAFGLSVLLFSTLSIRSFASVLLGLGFTVGVWFLMREADVARLLGWSDPWRRSITPSGWAFGLLALSALLLGARMAFARGPIHTARRLRVSLLAFAPVLLVALPVGAYATFRAQATRTVTPHAADTTIQSLKVSPDGRYVMFQAMNTQDRATGRTWVVRIEDGKLFTWATRRHGVRGWTLGSEVAAIKFRTQASGGNTRWWLHPETGMVVHRPDTREQAEQELADWRVQQPSWGTISRNQFGTTMKTFWVRLDGSEERIRVDSFGRPQTLTEKGDVLIADTSHRLVRVSVETGAQRVLDERGIGRLQHHMVSPSGRFVLARYPGETCVLDTKDGRKVWTREPGGQPRWAKGPAARDLLLLNAEKPFYPNGTGSYFDPATGRVTDLQHLLRSDALFSYVTDVQNLDDGRLVLLRYLSVPGQAAKQEILLTDSAGKIERVLYGPQKGEAQ